MGKNKKQIVLKRVFKDISNIVHIIEDTQELEKSCKPTNYDDEKEVNRIVEDTKSIIARLSGSVTKISDYFDKNYSVWQTKPVKDTDGSAVNGNGFESTTNNTNGVKSSNQPIDDSETGTVNHDHSETHINLELNGDTTGQIVTETESAKGDHINKNSNVEDTNILSETPQNNTADETSNQNDSPNRTIHTETVDATKDSGDGDKTPTPVQSDDDDKVDSSENRRDKSNPSDEKVVDDTSDTEKESKVFLKCIDINKLKALPSNGGTDDSVMVISDSEPEDVSKRTKLSNKIAEEKRTNQLAAKVALRKFGPEISISRIQRDSDNEVQVVEDQSSLNKTTSKSRANKLRSKKTIKDPLKISSSHKGGSLSSSDSKESDSETHKRIRRLVRKLPKPTKAEKQDISVQNDKKFGYSAYVLLPRYRCEKLKEMYLKKMEFDDIVRLTDLNQLKKRKLDKLRNKDSDTSSISEKRKKKRKQRHSSKSSDTSLASDSDLDVSIPKVNSETSVVDPAKFLLNEVGSATDVSADENEKRKKKKSKKSEKKSKSSDEESSDSKNKKKWRNDKLLRKNILDSDSDSEDEFVKFKKDKEKSKKEVKKRISRRNKKVVVDSDSSSDTDSKKKKKKREKSESSTSPSSSSSSSESESSHDRNKKTTKSRRNRIKRMKDSSSDEGKSTRKSIRKVIDHESLQETTKQAEKEEKERKARIADKQKKYNAIFDPKHLADSNVEKVVLDFDEKTEKELLSVGQSLVTHLKPHQAKGVHFMWDACFESLERTKNTNGSGCILAHCMGLGKTLQVITLIHTLITNHKETEVRNVMVVCPVNTVLNWVEEFKKWLTEDSDIDIYELVSNKQMSYREYLVKNWSKNGGVLIIGYDMFRNLSNPLNKRIRKPVRESFQKGLVDPGPDMIVCDEGHLLKNEKTNLSIAISRVRTERRIVLTGTPMQNNLKEYYCMVQFVKPNLLGTYKEYINRFVNPITNGQYTDSTDHDISVMKKRSHVLHKMLDGVVQRMDYNVLAPFLPPKYEYVLFTKLSQVQIELYQYYLDHFARRPVESKIRKTAFLFSDFQEFQRICTHPRVLLIKAIENRKKAMFVSSGEESEGSLKEFIDDDDDGSKSSSSSSSDSSSSEGSSNEKDSKKKNAPSGKRLTRTAAAAGTDVEVVDISNEIEDDANKWWRNIVDGDELENISLGGKLYLLFEIIQQCELIGDKILIFSQSLYSLNIIEYFLGKIDEATQQGKPETVCGFSGSWSGGLDYFRIDGSSSCDNRAHWCKHFNNPDNHRARLFLISTRAGGLGINLVGANRAVIFDVSWNPSHDTQSIYRIYRFGQTKPCYIYRFVTWGTMEMKIYERQVTKQAISKRVIDEQQIDRHYNQNDLAELYNFDPNPSEAQTPLVPQDILLAELLQKEKDRIYKYHEHQSLLENKEEEELDEAERKAAWDEYEHEKTNPPVNVASGGVATGGWIGNLPLISINAALLNILQRDNPTWSKEQVQAVIPIVIQQLREQIDKGETLLYNRIVNELKIIQAQQQQKLQQYYLQQQVRMLQQQQQARAKSGTGRKHGMPANNLQNYRNVLSDLLSSSPAARSTNPPEIVELND